MQLEKDTYKLKKFKLIFDPTFSRDTKLRTLENFFRGLMLNSNPPLLSAWFFFWFADFMHATNPYSKATPKSSQLYTLTYLLSA
jgi:hypothetical protein